MHKDYLGKVLITTYSCRKKRHFFVHYQCIFSYYVPLFIHVYELYHSMILPLTVLQKILLGALKW